MWPSTPRAVTATLTATALAVGGCGSSDLPAVRSSSGVAAAQGARPAKVRTASQWEVSGLGPGGRSVDVSYRHVACDQLPTATAMQTATSVTLTLRSKPFKPRTPDDLCVISGDTASAVLRVPLASPLAGRRILGSPGPIHGSTPGLLVGRTVAGENQARLPRFVGMSEPDALRLLRRAGQAGYAEYLQFKPRIRMSKVAEGPVRIVAQSPHAGSWVRYDSVVRLVVGRP